MEEKAKKYVDEYGFGQLDSWLIETYLRHKGETLEEAKERIFIENRKKDKNKSSN